MADSENTPIVAASPKSISVADRNVRLAMRRRKNLRYYGSRAYLVAVVQFIIGFAIFAALGDNGADFLTLLGGGLLMTSAYPAWEGTRMLLQSRTPPAIITLDEHEAEEAWDASNRLLGLLGTDPKDEPDPLIAEEAQIVVTALAKLSDRPLQSRGMYGYPPRHSTGENGVNHESDPLSDHVARVRNGLKDLMAMVAGAQDVPGTAEELQDAIGEVAAPLRVALRYHGIRLAALDDGRTTMLMRQVSTFDPPVREVVDPLDAMSARLGEMPEIRACRIERDRVIAIDRAYLDPDLRTETATVVDRHLPMLAESVIKAHDAAAEGEHATVVANAARSLDIVTDSLRMIVDTHAALTRQDLEKQTRFLASRNPQDPLTEKDPA